MRKEDKALAKTLAKRLKSFEAKVHALPGIQDDDAQSTLIFQMIESFRRTRFDRESPETVAACVAKPLSRSNQKSGGGRGIRTPVAR